MNTLTTNIIRNVYNIGTNSCSTGPTYCADGYALYFPCLKDVTKGQDVCFDFYVADYAGRNEYNLALTSDLDSLPDTGKELADLRDVDAISLNLIGIFNCPYGTYSYPDYISSLQTEEYPVIYTNDFGSRKLCHLQVIKIDIDGAGSDDQYDSQEGDYYSGTSVTISAYDTPTHIFEGWALFDTDDEDCPDSTIYGDIISKKNTYTFTIENDINIYAIYRPRKVYTIIVDPDNESSYFIVNYKNTDYPLRNKKKEIFNDGFDSVEVLEGYHFVAKCIPSVNVISNNPNHKKTTYKFVKWSDGNTSRCRLFVAGGDDETIKLKAECVGPVPYFEYEDETILYNDKFDKDGIHIDTKFSDITDYYGDEYTVSSDDVYHKFIDGEGYLYFNNKSTLVLSSFNIEDGVKINIHAKSDDSCNITVDVNGYSLTQTISNSQFMNYEFYFSKSNKSVIKISSDGKCLIDLLEVCREEIIDKGKARFCLSSEVTSKLPSGPLSVNGAIAVGELGVDENGELTVNDPQTYGLATTQIGVINRLPKITIN